MNKDMADGAKELMRRFLQRTSALTYLQVEDAGGVSLILQKEVVGMYREADEEFIADLRRQENIKTVDLI